MCQEYMQTKTWKFTLGREGTSSYEQSALEALCISYLSARSVAKTLAGEIQQVLPFFTSHDISHIDTLWTMSDLLLWDENEKDPNDKVLNPAEGYVLGISFLLHDLGMGLAAYQGGMESLKCDDFFKDSLADEFRKDKGQYPFENDEEWNAIQAELRENKTSDYSPIISRALTQTLRKFHADRACDMGIHGWNIGDETFYIIGNDKPYGFRDTFGKISGLIAASHGWSYEHMLNQLPKEKLSGINLPSEWTVDSCKLACILRAVDAMHIDKSRADSFLMMLRKIDGESKNHWKFQNKLGRPIANGERLCYQSLEPFGLDDMDAWWLCYDTLRMIDRELKDADTFLKDTGRRPFKITGVKGLSSTKELIEYVKTNGWIPVDTSIRVGDVSRLVSRLGGKQLYGDDSEWVPFRELIQNGADAIRARNKLKGRENSKGSILITLNNESDAPWISFTDNGIGMSEAVLTGPFLDFGQSFWHTSLMHQEWPGLAAKGFESTGEYGIGFYSVFMWSKNVKVVTRKYGTSLDKALVLEFRDGTNNRPVLRHADDDEQGLLNDYWGTCVIIQLTKELAKAISTGRVFRGMLKSRSMHILGEYRLSFFEFKDSLTPFISALCPCMDCNIQLKENNTEVITLSKADDWIMIEPMALVERMNGCIRNVFHNYIGRDDLAILSKNMTVIKDNRERIVGRAFLSDGCYGCTVIGGLRGEQVDYLGGVIAGHSRKADRSTSSFEINEEFLKNWREDQADKIDQMAINHALHNDTILKMSGILSRFGIQRDNLYIAKTEDRYLCYNDIICDSDETIWKADIVWLIPNEGFLHYSSKHSMRQALLLSTDLSVQMLEVEYDTFHPSLLLKKVVEAVMRRLNIVSAEEKFHVFTVEETYEGMYCLNNGELPYDYSSFFSLFAPGYGDDEYTGDFDREIFILSHPLPLLREAINLRYNTENAN